MQAAIRVFQIDNHGNRFLLKEEASLNVPAIAAAHVIKRYTAQASDEISIEVNPRSLSSTGCTVAPAGLPRGFCLPPICLDASEC